MSNFALIGTHRSGTNFLAENLNRALIDYTVEGEEFERFPHFAPLPGMEESGRQQDLYEYFVQLWFSDRNNYGKVCPQYVRYIPYWDLNTIDRKAVLVRHPYEYPLSMCRLNVHYLPGNKLHRYMIQEMIAHYNAIFWAIENGWKWFKFEDYTRKPEAIENIAEFVGAEVDTSKVDFETKVNTGRATRVQHWGEVFTRPEIDALTAEFDKLCKAYFKTSISERIEDERV